MLRHQLELETGLTDRWDVALYGIARQIERRATELEAAKLETRYALARPGEWLVDPVLYLEAVKTFVDDRPFSLEGKLILGRDLGPLNLSANVAAGKTSVARAAIAPARWSMTITCRAPSSASTCASLLGPGSMIAASFEPTM